MTPWPVRRPQSVEEWIRAGSGGPVQLESLHILGWAKASSRQGGSRVGGTNRLSGSRHTCFSLASWNGITRWKDTLYKRSTLLSLLRQGVLLRMKAMIKKKVVDGIGNGRSHRSCKLQIRMLGYYLIGMAGLLIRSSNSYWRDHLGEVTLILRLLRPNVDIAIMIYE